MGVFFRKSYGWIDTKVSIRYAQLHNLLENVVWVSPEVLLSAQSTANRSKITIFVYELEKNSRKNSKKHVTYGPL